MKKLKRNTAVRVIALFLQAFFIPLTAGLIVGAGVLHDCGAYDDTPDRLLEEVMDFDYNVLADPSLLDSGENVVEFSMQYPMKRDGQPVCNTVVTVASEDGNVILNNYEAEMIPSTVRELTISCGIGMDSQLVYEFSPGHNNPAGYMSYLSFGGTQNDVAFAEWLFSEKGINTYGMTEDEILLGYWDDHNADYFAYIYGTEYNTVPYVWYNVTLGVAEETVEFLSREHLLIKGYEYRRAIPVLTALCGFVSLVLALFLALSAGWRSEGDRPEPSFIERIPLELFLALAAALFALVYRFVFRPVSEASSMRMLSLLTSALTIYVLSFIAVGAIQSMAARFKCSRWWENTLVFRTGNLVEWTARSISDVGSVLVCGVVWLVVNLVLLAVAADRPALGLLLMGVFNLIVVVAAAAVAAQWQRLRKSAAIIAEGDSSHRVDTSKMLPPLRAHGESINRMGEGVAAAVDEQMKSERMKTDLITNVSHDIKTPLTSIVSYVGLLKNEEIESETAREYIAVLDRQATRLGRLIEDLVEASKATSGSIRVQLADINLGELLEQAVSEYEMRLEDCGITTVLTVHEPHIAVTADGRLLWRVFDNLLSNVCKYALAGTRLYIDATVQGERAVVTFRNISAQQLNIPAEELMERFVRGDSSRTTGGSGLGLTIARSLTEAQDGRFSLEIDGDMFKAFVSLPAVKEKSEYQK